MTSAVTTRRSLVRWLTAALTASAVAGCGSAAKVGQAGILRVALNEYRVTPQNLHALNGALTIYIHNYGRLTHDLVISQDGRTEAASPPVAPGHSADLVATLTRGKYLMSSSILNDQALGAYGTLSVG